MNIFLIPYTWLRHFAVGFYCAGAALLAWWLVLALQVGWGGWSPRWDGAILVGALAGVTAGAHLAAEGALRRWPAWRRLLTVAGAAALAVGVSQAWYWAWTGLVGAAFYADAGDADLGDPSLVALTYRWPTWWSAGLAVGASTLSFRRGRHFFEQLLAGVVAGGVAGAAWHVLGYPRFAFSPGDLYLASAVASALFGGTFGVLAWGIPDALYAGWIRVVSDTRHARRIPIDGPDGSPRERFVGHFPRGLDLFLPAEDRVNELHLSLRVDEDQRYHARGLTIEPTRVHRFLERVNLRYDARRPSPLETRLASGDRLVLGPDGETVLEFLMLPKEEQ